MSTIATAIPTTPQRLLRGQHVLVAAIVVLTWLALIGGVLSSYILSQGAAGSTHSLPGYAAYDPLQAAPTSFGTLSVTRVDLVPTGDSVQVDVSLRVNNTQDSQIDAPRLEDLRLITTLGAEANAVPGKWIGPAVLLAHSSGSVDLEFVARPDTGLLWLEYRDPLGQWPIRVALGAAETPSVGETP